MKQKIHVLFLTVDRGAGVFIKLSHSSANMALGMSHHFT
jgi:hypothetical protein